MSVTNPLNTYISGASGLSYINDQEDSFMFMIHNNSGTQIHSQCYGDNCFFTFYVWVTSYSDCDGPQWIQDGSLCYDNCTSMQYFEFTNNSCLPCNPKCLTCYDATSCSSCFTSQKRILSNVSCVPIDGYY